MELTVKDRLVLLQILAQMEVGLTELRIVRELKESLSFTEEEHKALNLRTEGQGVAWNGQVDLLKDVPIGDVARRLIVRRFKELDRQRKLTDQLLDTLDKFPEVENSQ